ncbi:MAG: hypothetical protein WDM96_07435 [Lacunisphaera sp.]
MRFRLLAALFACVSLGHAASPEVKATATSPESPAPARRAGGALRPPHVPIGTAAALPSLRLFQGHEEGEFHDERLPAYPAGTGEALAWTAADPGAQIDELRVIVYDAAWKQLGEVPLPVQAAWHAGTPANAPAPWARELSNAQQRLVSQDLQQTSRGTGGWWDRFVGILMPVVFISLPGYPLLQAWACYRLRGARRLLAALPLCFMLPTYAFCLYALRQDSNLWPLPAIFLSPVAALLVAGLLIYFHFRPLPPRPASSAE